MNVNSSSHVNFCSLVHYHYDIPYCVNSSSAPERMSSLQNRQAVVWVPVQTGDERRRGPTFVYCSSSLVKY